MRYLESLSEGERVGGVVLVAGFTDDLGFGELGNFFETPLDFDAMKKHCPKFVAIHSDNDPYVPLRHSEILKEQLDAKAIIKHSAKHFSGAADGEDSCTELPDVVDAVVEMSSLNVRHSYFEKIKKARNEEKRYSSKDVKRALGI